MFSKYFVQKVSVNSTLFQHSQKKMQKNHTMLKGISPCRVIVESSIIFDANEDVNKSVHTR
jgi:hypothetical protein